MSAFTQNFNFPYPEGSELYNPFTNNAEATKLIDAQVFKNQNASVGVCAYAKSGTSHILTRTVKTTKFFSFTATSNFTAGDTVILDGETVTPFLPNGEGLGNNAFRINSNMLCSVTGSIITFYTNQSTSDNVGELENLLTVDKTNVVSAINENVCRLNDYQGITTYLHTKVGTVHTLSGGGNFTTDTFEFISTDSFTSGDIFNIGGKILTPLMINGESLVDNYFISGVKVQGVVNGEFVNFSGGSSSAKTNYNVITSATQPFNPTQNTIWIESDIAIPKNGYALSKTNPFIDTPTFGNIWIETSTSSSIVFSTSSEVIENQYVNTVYQYNGLGWNIASAKIYQNGAWYEIYGDIRTLMSNRTEFNQWGIQPISGVSGELVFDDLTVPPEFYITSLGSGTFSTNIKVDLTNYNTLTYSYLFPTNAGTLFAGVGSTADMPSPQITHTRSSAWQNKTIDVSSYTGEYYILFRLTTTASSPDFGLRNMILEK